QRHRLLSLCAARICRHQELDARHALAERALRWSDLLGPRPHRVRRPTLVDVANNDRSRLGATRLFLRGQGLVLRSRPLSAALPRQWGGGRCEPDIHVELPILWLLIGLSIVAAFASWANFRVRGYRLPAAAALLVFGGSFMLSGVVPALFQRLF